MIEALCAALRIGRCGGWALFAGGVGGAGDAGCAEGICMLEMLDVPEVSVRWRVW